MPVKVRWKAAAPAILSLGTGSQSLDEVSSRPSSAKAPSMRRLKAAPSER